MTTKIQMNLDQEFSELIKIGKCTIRTLQAAGKHYEAQPAKVQKESEGPCSSISLAPASGGLGSSYAR